MVFKLPCRFYPVIYRRRCIRLVLLGFFLSVSVGLMVKLNSLSSDTSLDVEVTMTGIPHRQSSHRGIGGGKNRISSRSHSQDVETRKARQRYASNGVKLVQEDKIHYFQSIAPGKDDEGLKKTLLSSNISHTGSSHNGNNKDSSGGADNNKRIGAGAETKFDNYVEEMNSHAIKHRRVPPTPTTHTLTTDKKQTTVKDSPKSIFLVILVISKPSNVLLRQAARKTWAKDAHYFSVLVRFVVGRLEGWDEIIDRESLIHSDMIVLEDQDTYETLPNKVIEGITWAVHQPTTPSFVMKIDDDTIINLPYLVSELFAPAFNSTQILGAICVNSPVIRDHGDKWAVSLLDFPFPTYPPYAFGGGYVMSSKCARILLDARSQVVDWIHLEDVYVTGILAAKSGISHVSHPGFSLWTSAKAKPCDFLLRKSITSVNHAEKEFFTMYEGIQSILRSGQIALHCDARVKNRTY